MLPGRLSELTMTRDNIHTFKAGEQGATILDFTAQVDDTETSFSALEIDAKPHDPLAALYRAKWLGNPYS